MGVERICPMEEISVTFRKFQNCFPNWSVALLPPGVTTGRNDARVSSGALYHAPPRTAPSTSWSTAVRTEHRLLTDHFEISAPRLISTPLISVSYTHLTLPTSDLV